ncbi:hypothetical protein [Clostridium thermobutyricum]|uniref:hypothetical protein n=1 Tax=Clostridium thermobutyricum TaxID=29372 RepID=UPI002942A79E|nr:hypothetical protein [Clostridium thermobutyricum]
MKKFLIGLVVVICILFLAIFGVYKFSFKPSVPVTPLDSPSTMTQLDLAKKFIPNNISLSLTGITATSNTNFSNDELTDLFISAFKDNPKISEYVKGLSVQAANNNTIYIYADINYKDIPVQAKLTFKCSAEDGKGIFHYESGKVGFISIPKEMLFDHLHDNSIIAVNKANSDIILRFSVLKNINIQSLSTTNGNLNIEFKGTLNFLQWLENNGYN